MVVVFGETPFFVGERQLDSVPWVRGLSALDLLGRGDVPFAVESCRRLSDILASKALLINDD